MNYREATLDDTPQLQIVRYSAIENVLSNPALVNYTDYIDYLKNRGKGWVCEEENKIVAFAIIDLVDSNVWALFVMPQYEAKGIGKTLHNIMLTWYFSKTNKSVWLSTGCNTRAETFYTKQGWTRLGVYGTKEIKFEMTKSKWQSFKSSLL